MRDATTADGRAGDQPRAAPAGAAWRWAGLTLAAVGLCICGYLAWLSLAGRAAPGCGSDAGCSAVLGSRWSAVGPVPVSVFAVVGYAVVFAGLFMTRSRARTSALWATAAGGMGVALIGAAVWFVLLQARAVGAWCPYCMAGHGVGVLLGALLGWPCVRQRKGLPAALLLGAALTGSLIGLQLLVPASVKTVTLPGDRDFDLTDGGGRHLGLLAGQLRFNAADTPHLGPIDGVEPVVALLDYACPHCRAAHAMLHAARPGRGGLVVFALPVSLDKDHNPHIPLTNARFEKSYELALLSLAVWREAPQQWPAFDRWLFEGDPGRDGVLGWPRSMQAAEAKAGELLGEAALAEVYRDQELVAQVERNIAAVGEVLAQSPGVVPGLPIVMSPFAGSAVYGRFDEPGQLEVLLEAARQNRP